MCVLKGIIIEAYAKMFMIFDLLICWFNVYRGGGTGLMRFLLIKRDTVFAGLIFTSQILAYCAIFSRSEFSVAAAVSEFSTTKDRLVSSAKSLIFDLISFTMSLTYRRNNSGPRIVSCGMPAWIKFQSA